MPANYRVFEFAEFRLDEEERVLYRSNAPVPLAPKVFDTLLALVTRAGRVVTKDELMAEVWRDTFVEENNLTQYIFTLRRILGEDKGKAKFIETVSKRGYRFVADVRAVQPLEDATPATPEQPEPDPVPESGPDARPAMPSMSGLESLSDGLSTTVAAPRRVVNTRTFLLLGFVTIALATTVGFALRSSWHSKTAKAVDLLRLSETGNLWGAAISADGKFLAYVTRDGGIHSVRLKNIETSSEIVVIPPSAVPLGNPRFSPDGNFIYLIRENDAIRVPILGGETQKVASNLWSNFSISPDGKQIAFPRDKNPEGTSSIVLAQTDGSGETTIASRTAPSVYPGWGPAPVFSPDVKRVTAVAGVHGGSVGLVEIDLDTGVERELKLDDEWASIDYVDWQNPSELILAGKRRGDGTSQLWRVTLPAGTAERVTNDFNNYLSFTLTADKSKIVALHEAENLHLWLFDAETGGSTQITSGVSRGEGRFGLAFAPDGQVVYTARDKADYEIYVVGSDGTPISRLTRDAGNNFDPVVSPDNELIAFTSDRTGSRRLWLMNRDGSEQRQLTTTADGNEVAENSPYFSADGEWIYFVSERTGRNSVWKISTRGGEPVRVGRSDKSADKPVPSPDGRLLAHGVYNDESATPWQIEVEPLDAADGSSRFLDFPAFRSRVRWTLDSKALVSVDDRAGGYNLWATDIASGERRAITAFKGDKIYRFDVSPDRRSYIIARGDYYYDAVLITR